MTTSLPEDVSQTRMSDLLDGWESYVWDLESNLKLDPETYEDYLKNPRPYLFDLLCDFGNYPGDYSDPGHSKMVRDRANAALNNYLGKNTMSQRECADEFAEEQYGEDVEFYSTWAGWYAYQRKSDGMIDVFVWNIFKKTFTFDKPTKNVLNGLNIH